MAETDVLYEFGREPGFSCLVFGPECSHILHMLLKAAAAEGINRAYTAALKRVPLCYIYSSHRLQLQNKYMCELIVI